MDSQRRKSVHDAISRLSDGDRSAMEVLVRELWPVLLDFARRSVEREQDAEDIAQEVFLRIAFRTSEFDRTRDGLSWAFGIAGYEILTYRRKRLRQRETLDSPELSTIADPRLSQEDSLIEADLNAALTTVLGEMSEDDRANLGFGALGATGHVSAPALRKRRQRALDRLRGLWRRFYGEF